MRSYSCLLTLALLAACGAEVDSGRGDPDAAWDGATAGDGGVASDGGASVDGAVDGVGSVDGGADAGPMGRTRYSLAAPHSPISPRVVASLRDIAGRDGSLDDTVFAKVGTTAGCIARDHHDVTADLAAGTYFIVVDSFVGADATSRAGEYLLVVEGT